MVLNTWQEIENATNQQIITWAETREWSQPMAKCQQDPSWHAEGDVWTHTKMVLDELFRVDGFQQLERNDQLILIFTALMHDSGKPATTRTDEQTGRIRSPKHAAIGARIARRELIELGCGYSIREHICNLILFHGRPPYLGNNRPAEHDVIRVSCFLSNRLLYMFALADTRGRICDERSDPEEILNMWRLQAVELDCFDNAFQFQNDHARFLYYRNQLDNLHYAPYQDFRCTMTIMCGLPGAGKDTWLNQNRPEMPFVSLDEIRSDLDVDPSKNQGVVVQLGKKRAREFLRNRTDFAINATNTTRHVRQQWIDLGADYNARIQIVYVEQDLATLLNQNESRSEKSVVPNRIIQRLVDRLDPPSQAECHDLVLG